MKRPIWTGAVLALVTALFVGVAAQPASAHSVGGLHIHVDTAGVAGVGVNSTVIYGRHDAILVDTEFLRSDVQRVADFIAAKHLNLKALVVSGAHPDKFFGTQLIHERFPNAKIYSSRAAIDWFNGHAQAYLDYFKPLYGAEMPDKFAAISPLPGNVLWLEGQPLVVLSDLQGDVYARSNNAIYVPSNRTLITGDIAFYRTHAYLAESDASTRAQWVRDLDRLIRLHSATVIAGHKADPSLPNSPSALSETQQYIRTFDSAVRTSHNAAEVVAAVKQRYPDLALDFFLDLAAGAAFPA
jgi:glyoxylase-like metal-dependent hydrolase (beta-lactamase superfamily II)